MTPLQKLIVLIWNLAVGIPLLFLFSRGGIGLCLWAMIANQILMYGTIRAWNTGEIRINGLQFTRQESSAVFSVVYWSSLVLFLLVANAPGVLYLAGYWPK